MLFAQHPEQWDKLRSDRSLMRNAMEENPDEFDIERKMRGHMGFGHGIHVCLGMHLARLEMHALFGALADRVERFEITGTPEPAFISAIHSLAHLPIRVTPLAA